MKKPILLLTILCSGYLTSAQIIAVVEMTEKIEGICNHDAVYHLFNGFDGQIEAKCSLTKEDMQSILNEELLFLLENPKYKSKGMVGVYINCEGEALQWEVSVNTRSKELDKQILAIFKTFQEWEAGTFNRKAVDTRELFSFKIKKGKLTIN